MDITGVFMKKRKIYIWSILTALLGIAALYLFLPPRYPHLKPADFTPLSTGSADGRFMPLALGSDTTIYGMGLTYSTHIKETASPFNPKIPPVIFLKELSSLSTSDKPVKIPEQKDLTAKAEALELGLGKALEQKYSSLPSFVDYEVELAFVLLSDIDWKRMDDPTYMPDLGYFIANDISARTLAVLGEGKPNKTDYWGASKSFAGFLPVGKQMWVPNHQHANSLLVITLTTTVNGQVRQQQLTSDLIYTPKQMLVFVAQKYPNHLPGKGDIVLTGTPGGVAMQVPYWKARLGNLLSLDALTKLSFVIRSNRTNENFIKPGDTVTVSGGILGSIQTPFIE
jgi:2-keto-4-pentenoate hydratase/2-oxohepta-3-ene-1,7-dioic acid hydratase in catechol pathway